MEIKKAEPRDANKSQDGQDQWGASPESQWGMPGMGPPGMPGINNVSCALQFFFFLQLLPVFWFFLEGLYFKKLFLKNFNIKI